MVLAAPGYPEAPEKDLPIKGDPLASTDSSYFLHAGTKNQMGQWSVHGGRVLNAIALASTMKKAVGRSLSAGKQGPLARSAMAEGYRRPADLALPLVFQDKLILLIIRIAHMSKTNFHAKKGLIRC